MDQYPILLDQDQYYKQKGQLECVLYEYIKWRKTEESAKDYLPPSPDIFNTFIEP